MKKIKAWLGGRWTLKSRTHKIERIDQSFISDLTKTDYTLSGDAMEPINLLIVGSGRDVRQKFRDAGWRGADPINPWVLLKSGWAVIFNRPYLRGPVTPLFVHKRPQDLAMQEPTRHRSFRRRHHVRLWRTEFTMTDGRPIWIASAVYDRAIKLMWRWPFVTHAIGPDLDRERELVIDDLLLAGADRAGDYQLSPPVQARNAYGDPYHTDGRVVALEL